MKNGYSKHGEAIELVTAEATTCDLGKFKLFLKRFTCLPVTFSDDDIDFIVSSRCYRCRPALSTEPARPSLVCFYRRDFMSNSLFSFSYLIDDLF